MDAKARWHDWHCNTDDSWQMLIYAQSAFTCSYVPIKERYTPEESCAISKERQEGFERYLMHFLKLIKEIAISSKYRRNVFVNQLLIVISHF